MGASCWIVVDDKVGVTNQCIGLAEALVPRPNHAVGLRRHPSLKTGGESYFSQLQLLYRGAGREEHGCNREVLINFFDVIPAKAGIQ